MICIHIVLLICYVPLFKIGLDLTQFSRLVLVLRTTFQNCCLLWIDNYNTKLSDFEIPTSIWNGFNKIMRRKYDVDLTRRVDTQNELLDFSDDLQREQITQPSSPWSPSGFYCL